MAPPTQFVLDGSIALCWYFKDEANPYADAVRNSLTGARAFVPTLWPLEVANALVVAERRGRSTEAQATAWLGLIGRLPIELDDQTSARAWTDTLGLARAHKLSAYDAAYLELALRRGVPLATLDAPLAAAAANVGVQAYRKRAP